MPFPTERAASGSRLGPSTISAITRITISSSGPGAEITDPRLADAGAAVVHSRVQRRVELLDLRLGQPAAAGELVDHDVPRRSRRPVRAEPGRVPAVRVAAGLPLVRVQPADASRAPGEV